MKKILIVEDDESIRESMVELLESEGYNIATAENGLIALDYLTENESNLPHLILLDLMMPVMDGFHFSENKSKIPSISHIPIVVLSADGHVKEKQEKAKAQAYLRKPVDIFQVLDYVKKYAL
ncbi:MAG: response regulator [Bdellovibrionota bacterium]